MLIHYTRKAAEQLEALSLGVQDRIYEKMIFYAEQTDPLRFADHVTLTDEYRFRIGDCRIRFVVRKNIIIVMTIKRRDKAYD